jgi:hypothetical protein
VDIPENPMLHRKNHPPSKEIHPMSSNRLSTVQRLIAEKTVCVVLVRGENSEVNQMFAYMAVRADKLPKFIEAQNSGMFYPEDFGVVIEAGEGEPSPEIREKMRREYGFNHDSMLDIPDPEKAHTIAANISAYAVGSK